jgi:hypothetical protein
LRRKKSSEVGVQLDLAKCGLAWQRLPRRSGDKDEEGVGGGSGYQYLTSAEPFSFFEALDQIMISRPYSEHGWDENLDKDLPPPRDTKRIRFPDCVTVETSNVGTDAEASSYLNSSVPVALSIRKIDFRYLLELS